MHGATVKIVISLFQLCSRYQMKINAISKVIYFYTLGKETTAFTYKKWNLYITV